MWSQIEMSAAFCRQVFHFLKSRENTQSAFTIKCLILFPYICRRNWWHNLLYFNNLANYNTGEPDNGLVMKSSKVVCKLISFILRFQIYRFLTCILTVSWRNLVFGKRHAVFPNFSTIRLPIVLSGDYWNGVLIFDIHSLNCNSVDCS